ncbi:predicted protein [Postia placenta Mad-698-R]|uniref:FAD-binding PCMH-type domain-containing protein n=1 Tax=Postia placenta MAD-698-R-SB12 TaxID=670580 RepID=A0A1X6MLN2_9APHY|nr:hypothetical protein POSPLADRAFT_1157259 [Postia placenta MAD-698-R-SB12]EED78628.1 predicted protein [Postia placenta Mad-698-R]OSX57280.1 hypothetical protein POSPLADRAFT_1157259 [Postia placenta MAD-698-R-SB12]
MLFKKLISRIAADSQYLHDISHYATSSTEDSVCSVEPGTAEDVGIILQILGENQTPFAVKDGGHIMNPGYSSTPGVTIAMTRFNTVNYDSDTETVAFGTGLVWDDVYKALDPYNVNVVGGRVSGIGVSGYTLGGGYSWLTNQYGLTLDTIQAFELVLPNGSIVNVTDSNNPDLFYGLKGIVTTFILRTFPQGEVWAGQVTYSGAEVQAVTDATYNFANYVVDPKAAIITTYDYIGGALVSSVIMFYDAPTPPAGIFDEFIAVPSLASTVSTQSFLSFILSSVEEVSLNCRGLYHTAPVERITPGILEEAIALIECQFWYNELQDQSAYIISIDIEPFLPTILDHGGPSAYPYTRVQRFLPLNLYFGWVHPQYDAEFYDAIVASASSLTTVALAEGQTAILFAPHYPNYAVYGTPLSSIYGTALSELTTLKGLYDPMSIMGLAGGWKVPNPM